VYAAGGLYAGAAGLDGAEGEDLMAAQRKEWRAVTAQQPDGDSTSCRCKLYFQAATCAAISQKQVGGFRESSGVGNHGHASKRG